MVESGSPLAQLADISEPPLLLDFALAPLWWLLIALVLAAVVYVALHLYRRWCYFAAKRQALQLLEQIYRGKNAATEINQLLKRVLRHYQPAHPALSMNSKQWQQWLSAQSSAALPDLTALLYQHQENDAATAAFYQFAKIWLRGYRAKAPYATTAAEVNDA